MPSRIAVLTDEPVLVAGLRSVLPDCEVLASAEIHEFVGLVARWGPGVVIVDADYHDPMALLLQLRARFPSSRILLWHRWDSVSGPYRALADKVVAMVSKTRPARELVDCVHALLNGGSWQSTAPVPGCPPPAVHLSRRERQLITLVAAGQRNREIAASLSITPATVRVYLTALFRKLGLKSRVELAAYGLTTLPRTPFSAEAHPNGSQ